MPNRLALALAGFGLIGLFSSAALAQSSPAFTPQQLLQAPDSSWPTNGGNLYNHRYSPLTQINRDNVASLKAEWRVHMNGSGGGPNHSGQAQPLFYDGTLYVPTGEDDVFAIDIETGQFKWVYQAELDPGRVNVCCGWVNRGVGMGDGQIYVGLLDARLVALDQETGKVNWEIQAEDSAKGYSITAAPLYYDGKVIVGFAGGEQAIRGRLKAYDAKTGELLWTFYTIPGPGEPGHDTWPQDNDAWEVGGAPIWQTPAVDPELGLLYFSTGNAGPDLNGSNRAGDNLFTVSGDVDPLPPFADTGSAGNSLRPGTIPGAAPTEVEPLAGYTANVAQGQEIYRTVCATCHGDTGIGGHQGGVPLKGKDLTLAHIMTMVSNGKNTMPAFAAAYSKEQMQDVATYVRDSILPE